MSAKDSEESPLTTWANAQQKALAGWLDLVQGKEKLSRTLTWNETVKTWQRAVQVRFVASPRMSFVPLGVRVHVAIREPAIRRKSQ
jgi:hypothetical protein